MKVRALSMSVDLRPVIYKAEALLLERSLLVSSGPRFLLIHRFRIKGTLCGAGEEVFAIFLLHRGRRIPVSLPLALRLLFDYLARHCYVGQNASQIAAGMRASAFYRNHGINSGEVSRRKFSRSAVKEYVLRIRRALETLFVQVSVPLDPSNIVVSEQTEGNEVLYRLRAMVRYLHCDELSARR
jgi:hypothetical protein